MEQRDFTCIGCPMGCRVIVSLNQEGIETITGNTCKIGENYVRKEITDPSRIVTSTIAVINGELPAVSVKSETDVPKDKIFDVIKALKGIKREAPIAIGDIILENVCGTGVNIIATKNIKTS